MIVLKKCVISVFSLSPEDRNAFFQGEKICCRKLKIVKEEVVKKWSHSDNQELLKAQMELKHYYSFFDYHTYIHGYMIERYTVDEEGNIVGDPFYELAKYKDSLFIGEYNGKQIVMDIFCKKENMQELEQAEIVIKHFKVLGIPCTIISKEIINENPVKVIQYMDDDLKKYCVTYKKYVYSMFQLPDNLCDMINTIENQFRCVNY